MWKEPDSALKVMLEFAGSAEADSLGEFEGHYCQVLVAELLFKNDYGQSNREEVLKAVGYFDSLVDIHGADTRGVSLPFIDARAHYINGAGFYERDSVVAACGEYLKALEMVETHFPGIETRHGTSLQPNHLPRFMALTYGRLGELFDNQFMQNAIYCYKKALVFNIIEPTSPTGMVNLLSSLGREYHFFSQMDSAEYYNNEAWKYVSDTNHLTYRNLFSQQALLNYYLGKGVEPAVNDLRYMVAKSQSEDEKLTRFATIGHIYYEAQNYDSALFYLIQVFENKDDASLKWDAAEKLRSIYQSRGDTLKVTQYAIFQAENAVSEVESNYQVSQLNELFQQHLQWEQERAEAERRQAARQRRNRMIVVVSVLVAVAALLAWLLIRRRIKQQRDEASQQMEAEREAHRLEKASMSGRLKRSNQELRELKDQMRQQTGNGAPKQEAQAVSFNEEPICRLIMERVNEGLFKAQMDCKLYQDYALGKEQVMALREAADRHFNQFTVRLAKAYPNLTKGDLDYCCLYLLGLSDADISALMQRAYATVSERSRKIKTIFGTEEPLSVALLSFANGSASI
jgi:tetratricopeptide (TPR) repeat protein